MTENTFIGQIEADGNDIAAIVESLQPVLTGLPRANALIACLSVVLTIMNPDITADELSDGITETSRFICMFLAEREGLLDGGTVAPELMN